MNPTEPNPNALNDEEQINLNELTFITPQQLMEQSAALCADKVFLVGEITEELATNVCRQMMLINEKNVMSGIDDPIHLIINSGGGCLYSAWLICDIMDSIATPVHTYGFGAVASAGLIIFMNGDYKHRYTTKNTQFMSHRFSMAIHGNHSDLMSHHAEIPRMHTRVLNHYKKCTGLSVNEIENDLLPEHNVWLTASQAKKYKIADKIMSVRKRHIIDFIKDEEKSKKCQKTKCKTKQ